ncbi:acylphosphatase [Candidatus Micrarchaeota archaeon]|nr:acylphosphatase [Candidatus Micrarchaeota archaeon]
MKRRATSIVRGRVQGVGYRDRVLEKALELGIAGFEEFSKNFFPQSR